MPRFLEAWPFHYCSTYLPLLWNGLPHAEGCLKKGDNSGHEEDGGDDVAAGGVVGLHAQGRADDEGDGHSASEHRQVVLKRFNLR